jgi:alpha-beta hydrolase superfamily lysophospholipase
VEIAAVTAEDGYLLRHRLWSAPAARADVVAFNGIMSHSAWMAPLAERLVDRGVSLIGADRRGTGLNRDARGDAVSADILIGDAARIIRHHGTPERPLFLLGWCWGASLALNVMKQVEAAGLILIAPGLWPTEHVQAEARRANEAARGLADDVAGVATPVAEELFTRGPALEGFIKKDDLRLTRMTPRFRKAMDRLLIHALASLRHLTIPLLAILANEDEATDSSVAERALSRLDSSSTTLIRMAGPHGLIFERAPELTDAIVAWLDGLRGSGPSGSFGYQ